MYMSQGYFETYTLKMIQSIKVNSIDIIRCGYTLKRHTWKSIIFRVSYLLSHNLIVLN